MVPATVDRMIADFKRNVARAGHLKTEIKRLELLISEVEEAELGLGAAVNDGMPHGSKVGDPTGMKGAALADGRVICEEERKELKAAQDELAHVELEILFVTNWLKVLNPKEKFVIEKQAMMGVSWREVESRFAVEFSDNGSKDTLRRIKAQGLIKIYQIAE